LRIVRIVFFTLFCVIGISRAAFTIEPTVITFDAGNGVRTAWADVVNTGKTPMAISLVVLERVLDIDGELNMKASVPSPDFVVHPKEIILPAKKSVRAQLMYKGAKVTADKAYLLFSKEVPVSLADEEEGAKVRTGVRTLMNYYTIIAFETGKSGSLTFVSSAMTKGGKVEVIAENKGNGRVRVGNLALRVGNDLIKDITGTKNAVMPGQKRRFTFKYHRPLTAGEVKFVLQ